MGTHPLFGFRNYFSPKILARLKGFEPPTHGFGGRCSIQLSYRRTYSKLRSLQPYKINDFNNGSEGKHTGEIASCLPDRRALHSQ